MTSKIDSMTEFEKEVKEKLNGLRDAGLSDLFDEITDTEYQLEDEEE